MGDGPVDADLLALKRRIKAAITLAGIDGMAELARRIDRRGLGESKLYAITNERRVDETSARIEPWHLVEIARATGVPVWFLEHGFAAPTARQDRVEQLSDRVARLERCVDALLRASLKQRRRAGAR
jgi:hypothetical protein